MCNYRATSRKGELYQCDTRR